MAGGVENCEYVDAARLTGVELGQGCATINVTIDPGLFYRVLGETTGLDITDEAALMATMMELADVQKKYAKTRAPSIRLRPPGTAS